MQLKVCAHLLLNPRRQEIQSRLPASRGYEWSADPSPLGLTVIAAQRTFSSISRDGSEPCLATSSKAPAIHKPNKGIFSTANTYGVFGNNVKNRLNICR